MAQTMIALWVISPMLFQGFVFADCVGYEVFVTCVLVNDVVLVDLADDVVDGGTDDAERDGVISGNGNVGKECGAPGRKMDAILLGWAIFPLMVSGTTQSRLGPELDSISHAAFRN